MSRLRNLAANRDGATLVEFALVSPLLMLTLMGIFDLGHTVYTDSLLEGAIQEAARDSSIEAASISAMDAKVSRIVRDIAPSANITFTRSAYSNFSDVGEPEDFTDINDDSACNNGEPYEDANGNGAWDADRGKSGSGGARDAVLYTVEVTYPRLFPMYTFLGWPDDVNMSAATVLRNQPYTLQAQQSATVKNCA